MNPILLAALLLAAAAAAAYLLGSIDFGVVVSRLVYREDVRSKGSGNAGATNMLRTYGKAAAALTLAGDLGKGVLAVALGRLLFGLCTVSPEWAVYGGYVAAIFAVCGHLWPVWFGFKGGKGVAVAAGAILATEPVVLLALAVVFFALAFATRIVSLSSVTVAALYPVFTALWSWYTGRSVWFTTLCALVMGLLVIWMHRANIQRLKNGTEYKFGQKK
ncbi:glycerol-3-phosphate 1-O-acyltransferase PlsY [Allofournierella sp.]|uniref:glycerol-3-phosphate 1-O-acyltransferase PlsY n=1 Tax=Allofournierella sp. TaxID=1940256 RepID=UPI003AB5F61E